MVRNGLGRHIFYLSQNQHSLEQLSEAIKLQCFIQIVIIVGVMFVKVSIALFLLRIFGLGHERWWRWSLYFIMWITVLTSLSSAIIALAQCRPIRKLWNPTVRGSCWSPETVVAFGEYNGGKSMPFFHPMERGSGLM